MVIVIGQVKATSFLVYPAPRPFFAIGVWFSVYSQTHVFSVKLMPCPARNHYFFI